MQRSVRRRSTRPSRKKGTGTCLSEHSERVTMRTWAQAAGVPPEVSKMLGRWAPSTDEGYVRAQRSSIIRAQAHVAHFVKANAGCDDPVDERTVLEKMGVRMLQLGYDSADVKAQIRRLRYFDRTRRREVRSFRWTLLDVEPVEKGDVDDVEQPEFPDFLPEVSVAGIPDSDTDVEEINPEVIPNGYFVVSKVGKTGRKTLHKKGECYRVPGVHYADFEIIGPGPPEPERYHQACKACFETRGGARRPLVGGDVSGSDEGTVSSSEFEAS